jgi:ribonuclease P protein component
VGSESPGRTFGRADRLRSSREFQRVSRRGRRATSEGFVVLVVPRVAVAGGPEASGSRLGLTVSRRVGGAVVRNRVKRRLREWFRQSATRSAGAFDWVVIARPAAAGLASHALRAQLDGVCERALAGAKTCPSGVQA